MKGEKKKPTESAPEVTTEQLAELRARLAAVRSEPVLPTGTVTRCPNCGGRMVTTNDLERTVATPGIVYVVARLPGARCIDCESTEVDGSGVGILETRTPRGMIADYETSVSHSSGTTLGTYFKLDLVRVLGLSGNERLYWKVVDRDRAVVEIRRSSALTSGEASNSRQADQLQSNQIASSRKRGKRRQTRA